MLPSVFVNYLESQINCRCGIHFGTYLVWATVCVVHPLEANGGILGSPHHHVCGHPAHGLSRTSIWRRFPSQMRMRSHSNRNGWPHFSSRGQLLCNSSFLQEHLFFCQLLHIKYIVTLNLGTKTNCCGEWFFGYAYLFPCAMGRSGGRSRALILGTWSPLNAYQ